MRWRSRSVADAPRRTHCEVCKAEYSLSAPQPTIGCVVVPQESGSPLHAAALVAKLSPTSVELREIGAVIQGSSSRRNSGSAYTDSLEVTRVLAGPRRTDGDWAMAALPFLPICWLPASVEVNGDLARALRQPQAETSVSERGCVLAGPAAAVREVCEALPDPASPAAVPRKLPVLQFAGCITWPRSRFDQLVEHGVLGAVADATLEEIFEVAASQRPSIDHFLERARFAAGAWAGAD